MTPHKLRQKATQLSSTSDRRGAFSRGVARYRTQLALERKRAIHLGTTDAGAPLYLSPKLLDTHVMIQAPTGHGKTFLARLLFRELAQQQLAALYFDDPKHDFLEALEEDCAALNLAHRVTISDTSDRSRMPSWNPLKKNGIAIDDHTSWILTAIRSCFQAEDFDNQPQRRRWLSNAIWPVVEMNGSFDDVLDLLNFQHSTIRHQVIEYSQNQLVRQEWASYAELSITRRRDETYSAYGWLRKFCENETFRQIFMPHPHSFDLGAAIKNGGIVLDSFPRYRPLDPELVNFMRSLRLQFVLAYGFHIPLGDRPPLYVCLDEAEHVLSRDTGVIETILSEGRSLGIFLILIFHSFAQVAKNRPELLPILLTNCRTKIIGGHLPQGDLDILSGELFVTDWHPHIVRDEITALEVEPVETTRVQRSISYTVSRGRGLSLPENVTEGTSASLARGSNESVTVGVQHSESAAETIGTSRGRSLTMGKSETEVDSWAETDGDGDHWTEGESTGTSWGASSATSLGHNASMGHSTTMTPYGEELTTTSHETFGSSAAFVSGVSAGGSKVHSATSGGSSMHASTIGGARGVTRSLSEGLNESESHGRTTGTTMGKSVAMQNGTSEVETTGTSHAVSRGRTPSWSAEVSHSESMTIVPFHELCKRWRVASREFLSLQDFLTTKLIKLKSQPRAHWAVQTPQGRVVFFRALFVKPLVGGKERLAEFRAKVFSKPWYQCGGLLPLPQETQVETVSPELLPMVPEVGPDDEDFAQPVPPSLL
jgi:Helicase HerA, central domain